MCRLRSDVPEGASGRWRIERFDVPAPDVDRHDERPIWARDPAGTYTHLLCDDELYMSDLYAEIHTQLPAIHEARRRGGRILVTGLGLGLVVDAILAAPSPPIDEIVVIELSGDVIGLVEPTLLERHGSLVHIVQADARRWDRSPGDRFTVGWHDIWPSPRTPSAIAESHELIARFSAVCDWQGAWPLTYLEAETQATLSGT